LRPSAGAHGVLGITGEKLEAEVGEQWLGATPLWAVVPAGSNTIALRDLRDRGRTVRSLQTLVRSAERTELALEPSSGDGRRKLRAARSEPSPAEPRVDDAAERTNESSAEALYAAAERTMREGQVGRAAELLEELLVKFPAARNRDLAQYDLALAAYKQGDYAHAIGLLERLEQQSMRPSLRELSAYLRCRAVHARTPEDAPACFEGFRRRFPNSPHAKETWQSDGRARLSPTR
jgi:TolA-binding protein